MVRKAFGLPQALMIIIFIGTLVMLGMKFSKVSVNHYGETYMSELARLFAKQSIEHALYDISSTNRATSGCWKGATYTDKYFSAEVKVLEYYYFKDFLSDLGTCPPEKLVEIDTESSHGYVRLLVSVKLNSTNYDKNINITQVSLQRP